MEIYRLIIYNKSKRIKTFDKNRLPNPYEAIMQEFCAGMIQERKAVKRAKKRFQEATLRNIREKYPNWDDNFILDTKAKFQTFDTNQDGVIDFLELSQAMDEWGDTTATEARRKIFDHVNTDHSDGIDFEQFCVLVDNIKEKRDDEVAEALAPIIDYGADGIHAMRQLYIEDQLYHGLF